MDPWVSMNSGSSVATVSSSEESDEDDTVDLRSVFIFQPENKKVFSPLKSTCSNVKELELEPEVDLELRLCSWASKFEGNKILPLTAYGDEASSCWKTRSALLPLQTSQNKTTNFYKAPRTCINPQTIIPSLSSHSSVASNSVITQPQQSLSFNWCQVEGCGTGARGDSVYCISDCSGHKGAEGEIWYCKVKGDRR